MSQTGYTPISIYSSATASAAPLAANLVQGELAINTNDGKLFYKDSAGVVQTMASKATGAIGGSTTQIQFNSSGALAGSASLTWNGTVLTSSGFSGPLNGTVGATTANTGAFTTVSATGVITSTLATGTAPFTVASTTQVANLNAATAGNVTGTVAVANGGTGITAFGTGVATALGTNVNASSGITTPDGTATLTNKRIDPRVSSTASASSVTPTIASYDEYAFTALAATLTINAPTGTPVDGDKLIFRILDNGTPQTLSWNATYTVIGTTLPTTTTASKTVYVGCIYNANNTRWDVVAVATQA